MKTLAACACLSLAPLAATGCHGTVDTGQGPEPPHDVTVLTSIPYDDFPGQLALGPETIYWLNGNTQPSGGVWALPKSGGTSTVLADGQSEPVALAYADGTVYWTSDGLWSVPAGGGTPEPMSAGFVDTGGIAVDGGEIWGAYYDNGISVVAVSTSGGATTTLFSTKAWQYELGSFALAPGQVVWTTWDDMAPEATLWTLPRTGGTPRAIATSSFEHGKVLADATHAYWALEDTIEAVPLAGGAPTTIASGSSLPVMALDGSDLYWSDGQSLLRTPTTGGPSVVVAGGQQGIANIVTDTTRIYWLAATDTGDWEIRTISK